MQISVKEILWNNKYNKKNQWIMNTYNVSSDERFAMEGAICPVKSLVERFLGSV